LQVPLGRADQVALTTLVERRPEALEAARGAGAALPERCVFVVVVGGAEGEAGVVQKVIVYAAVGVGAVFGRARACYAAGGAFLAEVWDVCIDELAVGTGDGACICRQLLVVDGSADVGATLATGEPRSSAGEAARRAGIAGIGTDISPEAGRTILQTLTAIKEEVEPVLRKGTSEAISRTGHASSALPTAHHTRMRRQVLVLAVGTCGRANAAAILQKVVSSPARSAAVTLGSTPPKTTQTLRRTSYTTQTPHIPVLARRT
jgi:hypothetical protein